MDGADNRKFDVKSVRSVSTNASSKSVKSAQAKSRVKLKLAALAKEQEVQRVYNTRLQAKRKAEQKKQAAIKAAQEEADRYLEDIEQETANALQKRDLDLTYAQAEVEAWSEAASSVQKEDANLDEVEDEAPAFDHLRNDDINAPTSSRVPMLTSQSLTVSNRLNAHEIFSVPQQSTQTKIVEVNAPGCSLFQPHISQTGHGGLNTFAPEFRPSYADHPLSNITSLPDCPIPTEPPTPYPKNIANSSQSKTLHWLKTQPSFHYQAGSRFPLANNDNRFRQPIKPSTAIPKDVPLARGQVPQIHSNNYAFPRLGERLLPLPQMEKFDGDPMNYWTFIRQFRAHILDKVKGEDIWLLYLIQHCDTKVRSKIDHLTSKEPSLGFNMAWAILFENYGHSHEIARCCEERLRHAPKLKEQDPDGLRNLATLMDKCCTSLQHLERSSTLDSMDVMLSVIWKLPAKLQDRWIERSVDIERQTGDRAKFMHLSDFVNEHSRISNSIFSRAMHSAHNKPQQMRREKCMTSDVVTTETPPRVQSSCKCVCCSASHKLSNCSSFKAMTLDERKTLVRKNKLCFRCLNGDHQVRFCKVRETCASEGCTGKYHHTLLHGAFNRSGAQQESTSYATVNVAESNANVSAPCVYLNVVPVRVRFEDKERTTYAFLDQGSTTTFCANSLVEALNATGNSKCITLRTLTASKVLDTVSLDICVQPVEGGNWMHLNDVVAIDNIPVKPNTVPEARTLKKYPHLRNLQIPHINTSKVELLIGANFPEAFRVESLRKGSGHCPDAIRTPLGWSLLGPSFVSVQCDDVQSNFVSTKTMSQGELETAHAMFLKDESDLQAFVDLEESEKYHLSGTCSLEDRKTHRLMKEALKFVDGHYQLPLPWRHDHQVLPDSAFMASKRLQSLKRKLLKNPDLMQKYVAQMDGMLEKGYAEEVPPEEVQTSNRVWYLPHHAAINPKKPEKVRIVFDCAARSRGVSINDALMQGPDLVNSLVGVLTRFRKGHIAIISDVEAMFHQVRVAPRDRDCLRFWWWPNGDMTKEPTPHRMTVHIFGATSSPSCASFCLRQTAMDFGAEFEPYVTQVVQNNFYVDDCLMSVPNAECGIKMIRDLRTLLAKSGFHLTKWLSNSQEVLDSVPVEEQSKLLKVATLNGKLQERVLGINWNVQTDNFVFTVVLPMKPRTRRGVLSTVNSLFDPLGFVTPVVLEARLIYRQLCRQELEWDEPMPENELKRWENWLASLPSLNDVTVPRNLGSLSQEGTACQLHYFSDASKVAYGAVGYLRTVDCNGNVQCHLIMGKAHLTPTDETSIPRLELMAAVLAVKMDQKIRRELELQLPSSVFWSDSSVVLQSLHNERKRFPLFVFRRLALISQSTNTANWRHVPTKLNPADLASRGASVQALLKSGLWFSGPDFLKKDPNCWPSLFKKKELSLDEVNSFTKTPKLTTVFACQQETPPVDRLISHFSSYFKLKKATAVLLRFKDYLRSRYRKESLKPATSNITVSDLKNAEVELIKYEQKQHFPIWMNRLPVQKDLAVRKLRPISKLNPILDQGVLRVGGRLDKAPIGYEARHPAIMPHTSYLTDLMIAHYHNCAGHSGYNHTMSLLNQHVWISRGTAAVKRVIANCLQCRLRHGCPGQQLMAELPSQRLQKDTNPFAFTGVDYFGPLYVRHKRSEVKRYGCLFTCLTTRAIHLEVACDLSTDGFINALRRFLSRRGPVVSIYSDNGTNFVGANRILREAIEEWNQKQVETFLQQKEIQWHFNPPMASHMGGAWERMVRSVRRILASLSSERVLSDDQLHTLLLEAESILNSRPLIPVTMDPDSKEVLTPNHLLKLYPTCGLPPALTDQRDCYARRRWKQVQYLADQFWKRWSREYLNTIISRQKWRKKKQNFEAGDTVLIVDPALPRGQWPLGRILDVFPDEHKVVRTVSVLSRGKTMRRPIHKLCLICPVQEDLADL